MTKNETKMRLLFVFGTRPEGIKLAPVIRAFSANSANYDVKICLTGQHRQMLDQVMQFYGLQADYDIDVMKNNQSLFDVTSSILRGMDEVLTRYEPDLLFVQGDTTSAFTGALAGFYKNIKIAHIEAGLRSYQKRAPFPEEMNRLMVGRLADIHFAPTEKAKNNLLKEGISDHIYVVGNTVIDALYWTLDILERNGDAAYRNAFSYLDFGKKIVLVTGHRRENFGDPLRDVCLALNDIADRYRHEVQIVYPVHLNPNVVRPVKEHLSRNQNIFLVSPLDYPSMVWLMHKSHIIITDSGGIQEEAPSLGKPVLVIREVTERLEGIEAGTARLVGTDRFDIVEAASRLIEDHSAYSAMAAVQNPYGDGQSSLRIIDRTRSYLESFS